MSNYRWMRSSFCANGACVQVRRDGHSIVVRDGKAGEGSLEQCWSPNSWRRLVAALARGEDHPDVAVDADGATLGRILPLRFTAEEWAAFVAGVKAGEFTPERPSSPAPSTGGCDAGRPVGSAGNRPDHAAAGAGGDCPAPVAPAPVAAHHQTAGWGGVPGECGVECACGTTFDGFDTIAEAAALLDGHIATANSPDSAPVAAQPDEISDELVELVAHTEYGFDGQDIPADLDTPWSEADPSLKNYFVRRAKVALEVAIPLLREQWEAEHGGYEPFVAGPGERDVVELEPAWGSGPLVEHNPETPADSRPRGAVAGPAAAASGEADPVPTDPGTGSAEPPEWLSDREFVDTVRAHGEPVYWSLPDLEGGQR